MKINSEKTKIIPFNFSNKYDFVPRYSINGEELDIVYEAKLLGIHIQSNCKWSNNTKNMIKKANSRLWFLRRLKMLGASQNTLIDLFKLFVRSALEPAVPLWAGAILEKEKNDLEKVQKNAMKLIAGTSYRDYIGSITKFKLDTLDARRKKICLKFAKKCFKNERFKQWFKLKPSPNTRYKEKYLRPKTKTKRYARSAIPYLTDLLNEDE